MIMLAGRNWKITIWSFVELLSNIVFKELFNYLVCSLNVVISPSAICQTEDLVVLDQVLDDTCAEHFEYHQGGLRARVDLSQVNGFWDAVCASSHEVVACRFVRSTIRPRTGY
jgi:hypothetical protein